MTPTAVAGLAIFVVTYAVIATERIHKTIGPLPSDVSRDGWPFGQPLHASQIIGRAQSVQGVEHVISVKIKRWNETGTGTDRIVSLRHNEIIRVVNDPDHLERGFIFFDLKGGRQ